MDEGARQHLVWKKLIEKLHPDEQTLVEFVHTWPHRRGSPSVTRLELESSAAQPIVSRASSRIKLGEIVPHGFTRHANLRSNVMNSLLTRLLNRSPRAEHLTFRVYSRAQCCCCHRHSTCSGRPSGATGFAIEEVDIDSDPVLVSKYGTEVPVVAVNGKVRFRGVVNPALLERLLLAESRNPSTGASLRRGPTSAAARTRRSERDRLLEQPADRHELAGMVDARAGRPC